MDKAFEFTYSTEKLSQKTRQFLVQYLLIGKYTNNASYLYFVH